MIAEKNGKTYQIECKRQQKSGSYFYKENEIRQKMVHHIAPFLITRSLLLEIVFHVELKTLPETYLKDLFTTEASKLTKDFWCISNDKVDIKS